MVQRSQGAGPADRAMLGTAARTPAQVPGRPRTTADRQMVRQAQRAGAGMPTPARPTTTADRQMVAQAQRAGSGMRQRVPGHYDDAADRKFVDPGSYVRSVDETGALGYGATPAPAGVDPADRKFLDPGSYVQNVDETGALGYGGADAVINMQDDADLGLGGGFGDGFGDGRGGGLGGGFGGGLGGGLGDFPPGGDLGGYMPPPGAQGGYGGHLGIDYGADTLTPQFQQAMAELEARQQSLAERERMGGMDLLRSAAQQRRPIGGIYNARGMPDTGQRNMAYRNLEDALLRGQERQLYDFGESYGAIDRARQAAQSAYDLTGLNNLVGTGLGNAAGIAGAPLPMDDFFASLPEDYWDFYPEDLRR